MLYEVAAKCGHLSLEKESGVDENQDILSLFSMQSSCSWNPRWIHRPTHGNQLGSVPNWIQ